MDSFSEQQLNMTSSEMLFVSFIVLSCVFIIGLFIYYIVPRKTTEQTEIIKHPTVVVCTKNVLLTPNNVNEWKYNSLQVDSLKRYLPYIDLYIITQVDDQKEMDSIKSLLLIGGICGGTEQEYQIRETRLLFCQTDKGVYSFTRQLNADFFFDSNETHLNDLKRFVKNTVDCNGREGFDELNSCLPN
ncbi:hypothetical protein WA158_001299 [Blastocystis sp. Blastoise]